MISLPRLRFVAVLAALLVSLGLLASSASADKPPKAGAAIGGAHAVAGHGASAAGKRDLTVMTQNLYLGSSLTPALDRDRPDVVRRGRRADLRDGAVHELPGARRGDRRRGPGQGPGPDRPAGGHEVDDRRPQPAARLRLPRDPAGRSRKPRAGLLGRGRRRQREHRPGAACARRAASNPPRRSPAPCSSRIAT